MMLRTCCMAVALALAPSFAAAQCSWGSHDATTASQCGEGQVLDASTGTCVDKATS